MARIWLAAEERTRDLLPRLDQAAASRDGALAAEAARQETIPALGECPGEAAELDRWLALLRAYGSARVEPLDLTARPGLAGRVVLGFRRLLWRLLRHQHERLAVRQNAVNRQVVMALEAVLEEQRREIGVLRERVEALEKRGGGAP